MNENQNLNPSPAVHKSLSCPQADPARKNRLVLRDAATRKLKEAEAMLAGLLETYPEGGRSACHPASVFTSTALQVAKLRKALARSAV